MAIPKEQRRIFFQPGSADTGQANTLARLTTELQRFQQTAASSLADIRQTEGAIQAAGVSDTDELKPEFGAFNKAYNSVVRKNYLLGFHNDAAKVMSAKTREFQNDPAAFNKWFTEYRQGVMGGVDASILDEAGRTIDGMAIKAEQTITTNVHRLNLENQKDQLEFNLSQSRDNIMVSLAEGDEEGYLSQFQAYQDFVDDAVVSGFMTVASGKAKILALQKQADSTSMQLALDEQYDAGTGIQYISSIIDSDTVGGFSPEEKDALVTSLISRYNQRATIDSKDIDQREAARKVRHETGLSEATLLFLDGKLDVDTLEHMVSTDQIDPKVARSLSGELKHGGAQFDNSDQLLIAEVYLEQIDEDEILGSPELTNATKSRLIKSKREGALKWRSDPNVREGLRQINVALGLPDPSQGLMLGASKADLKTAGQTATKYFERLEMLGVDQRSEQAVVIAKDIVRTELLAPARDNVTALEKKVAETQALLDEQKAEGVREKKMTATKAALIRRQKQLDEARIKLSELE